MNKKRLIVCIVTGMALGVVCIIGAQIRSGFAREAPYLFAFWYNRLLMGLMIGLAPELTRISQWVARGAVIGFLVSLAFFADTGFSDVIGLLVGIAYGIIIEYAGSRFGRKT